MRAPIAACLNGLCDIAKRLSVLISKTGWMISIQSRGNW